MFTYVHYVMTEDAYTDLEREELKEASLNSLQVTYIYGDKIAAKYSHKNTSITENLL